MKLFHKISPACFLLMFAIVLLSLGCEQKKPQRLNVQTVEQPVARVRPCKVLLIGLDSLAASMERQWAARHETPLTITNVSRAEFEESQMEVANDINVLVYPSDMMVELIDNKKIDPLGSDFYDSDDFNKFSLLKHHRKTGIRFDGKPFAAPCGAPQFVQIYRQDQLAAAGRTIPKTWEQLIKTQNVLASAEQLKDSSATAVAIPLAESSAAASFLAISSPYVRQFGRLSVLFDRKTMKPTLESDGFVRALDDLKKLSAANPQSLKMNPADVYSALRSGKAAIGITWPQAKPEDSSAAASYPQKLMDELRVAPVPGADNFFDSNDRQWIRRDSGQSATVNFHNIPGVMVSSRRSRGRKQAAQQFIAWLTEPGIGEIVFGRDPRSGPFRATHLAKLEAWGDAFSGAEFRESWADVLRQSHEQPLIMIFPKISQSNRYLELLDRGIRKCLLEDRPAQESLSEISRQWESLTESIGRQKQLRLLERNESF
jgi:multiple sugar transport system substrate-binding protein